MELFIASLLGFIAGVALMLLWMNKKRPVPRPGAQVTTNLLHMKSPIPVVLEPDSIFCVESPGYMNGKIEMEIQNPSNATRYFMYRIWETSRNGVEIADS